MHKYSIQIFQYFIITTLLYLNFCTKYSIMQHFSIHFFENRFLQFLNCMEMGCKEGKCMRMSCSPLLYECAMLYLINNILIYILKRNLIFLKPIKINCEWCLKVCICV